MWPSAVHALEAGRPAGDESVRTRLGLEQRLDLPRRLHRMAEHVPVVLLRLGDAPGLVLLRERRRQQPQVVEPSQRSRRAGLGQDAEQLVPNALSGHEADHVGLPADERLRIGRQPEAELGFQPSGPHQPARVVGKHGRRNHPDLAGPQVSHAPVGIDHRGRGSVRQIGDRDGHGVHREVSARQVRPDVVDAHQVDRAAAAHHPVNGALGIQWERGSVEEGRQIGGDCGGVGLYRNVEVTYFPVEQHVPYGAADEIGLDTEYREKARQRRQHLGRAAEGQLRRAFDIAWRSHWRCVERQATAASTGSRSTSCRSSTSSWWLFRWSMYIIPFR